jgi:hypothetical protein
MPLAMVALGALGHRAEPIYVKFLSMFTTQLGGDPLYWAIIAGAAFYAYAAARRVPWAVELLTGVVLVLTIVDPEVMSNGLTATPQPAPLVAASTLLLGLGLWRRGSWRCLFGSLGLIACLAMVLAADPQLAPFRWLVGYHLVLAITLLIGATFDDDLARALRHFAPLMATGVCLATMVLPITPPANVPVWLFSLYPLLMAMVLGAYGVWLRHPLTMGVAGALLLIWSALTGWQAYRYLRQLVAGLDYLALGLCLFPVALAISLAKAGVLSRWLARWRRKEPEASEP